MAIELLQKEPKDIWKALKKEAAEELKAAKEKHKEAKSCLPSDVSDDVEKYIFILFFSSN
jgi:hypothetical protein